jgi:hypothetical protein
MLIVTKLEVNMIHYIEECDSRFCLKESRIPGAGRGVFTLKAIKKNDFLRVVGVVIKRNSIAGNILIKMPAFVKYVFVNPAIPGWLLPTGYGGMVNHTDNIEERNCDITFFGGDVYYLFTKDVEPDQELLGTYGDNWGGWNVNI